MVTKLLLQAAAVTLLVTAVHSSLAAPPGAPPNCSAIAFRPILARTTDGEQDAGLYKSRFGRIEVKASVKSGVAQNYFIEINGKPLQSVSDVPAAVGACAKTKRLPVPGVTDAACTGDQLQVLNVHDNDDRYVALYVHRAGGWHYCSAGTA